MGHLVQYRTASGDWATDQVVELEDALDLAARLRNDDRAQDVRVYSEVPLRFETYVRVSVAGDAADPADGPDHAPVEHADTQSVATVEDVPVEAAPPPVEPPPGAMPLGPVIAGGRPAGS